ncbi:MAG: hypothetical protein WAK17_16850 [Candidatus Nitrosopolaris sp.]|jgi:hypothetical protein
MSESGPASDIITVQDGPEYDEERLASAIFVRLIRVRSFHGKRSSWSSGARGRENLHRNRERNDALPVSEEYTS